MSQPIAFSIWFVSLVVGFLFVSAKRKRPYYQPIMAGEDPLQDGEKGWRNFIQQIHARRLLKLVYWQGALALLLVIVGLAWEPVTVLYAYYNPAPTPAATVTPLPGQTAAPAQDNENIPQGAVDPCLSPYPSAWNYPSECLP